MKHIKKGNIIARYELPYCTIEVDDSCLARTKEEIERVLNGGTWKFIPPVPVEVLVERVEQHFKQMKGGDCIAN